MTKREKTLSEEMESMAMWMSVGILMWGISIGLMLGALIEVLTK